MGVGRVEVCEYLSPPWGYFLGDQFELRPAVHEATDFELRAALQVLALAVVTYA